MNAAPSFPIVDAHRRLAALAGSWRGEEEMFATQWAPAGPATAEVDAGLECDGLYLVHRYRQARHGKPSFASHNVFSVDRADGLVRLDQFDPMGFAPVPAFGSWDGNTLVLTRTSERGSARVTYMLNGPDSYRTRLEFRPAGSDDWQQMASGVFRRISPVENSHIITHIGPV